MNSNLLRIVLAMVVTAGVTFFITTALYNKKNPERLAADTEHSLRSGNEDTTSFHKYPLATAISDIDTAMKYYNYVLHKDSTMGYDKLANAQILAYTVHASDLLAALGLPDTLKSSCHYGHVRVYLGFHPKADLLSPMGFKLFVVPVDSIYANDTCLTCGGTDLFFNQERDIVSHHSLPVEDLYVMDLNTPCPSFCDHNSPLFVNLPHLPQK